MQLLMKSCPYSRQLWKKADPAFFSPVTYWLTCSHSEAGSLGEELCLGDMAADGKYPLCREVFHNQFPVSISLFSFSLSLSVEVCSAAVSGKVWLSSLPCMFCSLSRLI